MSKFLKSQSADKNALYHWQIEFSMNIPKLNVKRASAMSTIIVLQWLIHLIKKVLYFTFSRVISYYWMHIFHIMQATIILIDHEEHFSSVSIDLMMAISIRVRFGNSISLVSITTIIFSTLSA